MLLALTQVGDIFKNLETGEEGKFFAHVADNVDWIVEETHPLAGHYHSKADFLAHTFERLAKVLPQGAQLHVEHALEWGLGSSGTAFPGYREEWPQVRQLVLLGLPAQRRQDR